MWSDHRRPSGLRITGGEDLIGIEEPADDLGLSTICATTAGPSRTDKRRMARPLKVNTFIPGAAG
jgi:hypothetical protein